MRIHLITILLGLAVTLPGCTSKPKPNSPPPQAKLEAPSGLRFGERIVSYHLGRTASGLQMQEAHPVYRIEESARWNLSGVGEGLIPERPALTPPILLDEAKAELYRQRELSRVMSDEARRLADSVKQLNSAVSAIGDLTREQKRISERLQELETRVPKPTNPLSR